MLHRFTSKANWLSYSMTIQSIDTVVLFWITLFFPVLLQVREVHSLIYLVFQRIHTKSKLLTPSSTLIGGSPFEQYLLVSLYFVMLILRTSMILGLPLLSIWVWVVYLMPIGYISHQLGWCICVLCSGLSCFTVSRLVEACLNSEVGSGRRFIYRILLYTVIPLIFVLCYLGIVREDDIDWQNNRLQAAMCAISVYLWLSSMLHMSIDSVGSIPALYSYPFFQDLLPLLPTHEKR